MPRYIAYLRGINVSGQKKIKMADLKRCLEESGLINVTTYIQSGNVVFDSAKTDKQELAKKIAAVIMADFGFEVPVLICSPHEIATILDNNPFADAEEKNLYFVLLHQPPSVDLSTAFNVLEFENEDFYTTDACIYLNCKIGAGKAKLNNNLIERKLKVSATTRNLNTMRKLLQLSM